jgi:hypothetical protein
MSKIRKRLFDSEADFLGLKITKHEKNRNQGRYYIDTEQWESIKELRLDRDYELKKVTKNKRGEVISETYGKKQNTQDFDTSKFTPISYTTNPFGDGKWAKYDLPKEERLKALREAIDALKEEMVPTSAVQYTNRLTNDKLINQYTLTDYHLGMMAWDEESGDNWDLKIAEDTLVKFFEIAIRDSANAKECVFAQIGDFLHWDGLDAVTPQSKHVLDADTRFSKLVRVAIRVIRRIIKMLLEKYETVNIIMAEGNHDPASSVWLSEMLSAFYDHEPRLKVDTNPDPYYCLTFGKVCLFYHHGHKKSINNVESAFIGKFKKEFGKSEYIYGHLGHLHHSQKETNLMILEQHRTLASKDAYSSRGGYLSGRDSKVITYHKDYGEVGRNIININMLK